MTQGLAPSRRAVSLLVLAVLLVLGVAFAADVLLTVFAGVLLAVFLRAGGGWIAGRLGIAPGWGVAIFALAVFGGFVGAGFAAAPAIAEQFNELVRQLPAALEALRERAAALPGGERLLERIRPEGLVSGEGRAVATTAVAATFGALGSLVLIFFVGLYGALDPGTYRGALRALVAPELRGRADRAMGDAAATLRGWLLAQLTAMAVVGSLTALGLWLLGIPLALILGLIAGLLAFVPNLGPIVAMVPGVLLASTEGLGTVLWVSGVYVGVQMLESYVVTPLLQQETVSLPPAFVLTVQLLMGVIFGLIGLAMATPLAAVGLTLTRTLYVRDYLERGGEPRGG
jgi:predicted PurR-regulated permease PerM